MNIADHLIRRQLVLTDDQHDDLNLMAERFGMEPEDLIAWAIELLTRYVTAGGEP